MKNILIIIALFAFLDSYATDPLSWGKKGGSGGVTQSQLDAKVDTSLIITGQEALDSLEANMNRLNYSYDRFAEYSNLLGDSVIAVPPMPFTGVGDITLVDNTTYFTNVPVFGNYTVVGIDIIGRQTALITADNINGATLCEIDGDSIRYVASTGNVNIWNTLGVTAHRVYFSAPVNISKGVYTIRLDYNYSASSQDARIYRTDVTRFASLADGWTIYSTITGLTDLTSPIYKGDLTMTVNSFLDVRLVGYAR